MKQRLLIAIAIMIAIPAAAQTEFSADQAKRMTTRENRKEASVHDPSVVYDPSAKEFTIIGSHIGIAKTTDLINLQAKGNSNFYAKGLANEFKTCSEHEVRVVRNGETTTDILKSTDAAAYCSTYAGIKVGDREATTETNWLRGNQWAPDIIYNPHLKKWCVYLSLNGDYWASVIVMLTADSREGPYSYQAPIVFGGFNGQTYSGKKIDYHDTDLEIVVGPTETLPTRYNTSRWGNLWPNCIDPCVFNDDEDNLWLIYGSWSGGIFKLKLDAQTGLRDYTTEYETQTYKGVAADGSTYTGYTSDPYFGKLIAGGAYVSGEGSYMQKIGNYYYLFVTYGGLAPDGGYEMRVFRSETHDGEFTDAKGMSARYSSYELNYGRSTAPNRGVKLTGAMNGWGSMTTGECAQGHNSAIVDEEGDAFLVYHTKFNNGSLNHEVRIRQLYINEKGWPVASPFRYKNKKARQQDIENSRRFTPEEIAGTYNLLLHKFKLNHKNMEEATAVKVTLDAEGNIAGDAQGTWHYSHENKSYVTININNEEYHGVLIEQDVDGYSDMPSICITATGESGNALWLYKYLPQATMADAYRKIVEEYIGNENTIIGRDAPEIDNADVRFEVYNTQTGEAEPETLSADGKYEMTEDSHQVTITVEIACDGWKMTAGPFVRATKGKNIAEETSYYPESMQKDLAAGWWSNFSKEYYTLKKGEYKDFHFMNHSDAAENWHNWALYGTSAPRNTAGYEEYFGVRCDNWDNTTFSNNGCSNNYNWDTFREDMNGSRVDMSVEYCQDSYFTMKADITTATDKIYNYTYKKTIPGSHEEITLFFVSEKSYIDGSGLSQVETVETTDNYNRPKGSYNLQGIPVGESYKGIIVTGDKKIIK